MYFFQHVQKTRPYKVLYRVSRDAPPDDAALAGKGAGDEIRKCSIANSPTLYRLLFGTQHATHAELEKELGFALQPTDLGASSLSRSSSDDSLSSPAASCSEKWGAPGLIHVVDQIYNPENTENTIDGSMLYSDINETAQLVARLTDEPSTRYYGESSGSLFT